MKIAHIINPVKVTEQSNLFKAQPITFESMRVAREFSKHKNDIGIYTTQFEEDLSIIPNSFTVLPCLEKSILDYNSKLQGKKLPLIRDILQKLEEINGAEYFIYTNADIALMPQFYDAVFEFINRGHDAIVINRRRLKNNYSSIKELPLMYSDMGRSHPGFDCFVFHKDLLNKFILGNICVGVPFLEVTLIHNLFSFANKPILLDDVHLTFHIGMDVLNFDKNAFYKHNRKEFFETIQPQLKKKYSIEKFPYSTLPIYKRALKWILNPSLFTRNYIQLEGKNVFQKIKFHVDEIRWKILQK